MIRVSLNANAKARKITVAVKGHAKSAPKGEDIVCSGVSMVTMMIAQHISDLSRADGVFENVPSVDLKNGDAKISFECADDAKYRLLKHDILVLAVGYFLACYNYPDRVKVTARGDLAALTERVPTRPRNGQE